MRKNLPILLILIICVPLIALSWMAQRMFNEQVYLQQSQYKDLLNAQLQLLKNRIHQPLTIYAQHFQALAPNFLTFNSEELRQSIRDDSLITHVFIVSAEQQLLFPPLSSQSSQQEKYFIQRTAKIRQFNLLEQSVAQDEQPLESISTHHGWYRWHWENGTNLLYWYKDKQQRIIAFELDFMGLLADIIGELPSKNSTQLCGQLLTSNNEVLYEWGATDTENFISAAQLTLPEPLDNWHLAYQLHPAEWQKQTGGFQIGILSGFAALFIVLILLGIYLYREFTRNLREASQRVNFVNQVSHELRTPLTNIRLYAELLHDNESLEANDLQKLTVIISESQRLGRLISNILSYARAQKQTLRIHSKSVDVVALISDTLEQFRPGFKQKNIHITQQGLQQKTCWLDADALSQILANLLSNAEKYGKHTVVITLSEQKNSLIIQVSDEGDGISKQQGEKIFQPFYRINNHLTEGVSGTGIGLSISRQLAHLHGGELKLIPTKTGTVFECRLPCKANQ